eukprot:CFRG1092T1
MGDDLTPFRIYPPILRRPSSMGHTHKNSSTDPRSTIMFDTVSAAFTTALHMHQPAIPAGKSADEVISNLQYMFEHPEVNDAHNAGPFLDCYGRMGDIIPRLVNAGCNPRVMLDYSGTLLWGLQLLPNNYGVFDKLKRITNDARYNSHVEWLGTFWAHAVAGSVPMPDIEVHITSWQNHFASLFGTEALDRVKGFSPPEMQIPNHPDVLYELVRTLKACGYQYMLVQEHTVVTLPLSSDDEVIGILTPHVPHVLVARNTVGDEARILVLIKTQGSDTKLVGQMQPYYEAKTLQRVTVGGVSIPPIVTQIADGENGGVMMNEFPGAFDHAWEDIKQNSGGSDEIAVGMNGSEYLQFIFNAGVSECDLPRCQAKGQAGLWAFVDSESMNLTGGSEASTVLAQEVSSGKLSSFTPPLLNTINTSGISNGMRRELISKAITALSEENDSFHMEGASWTNDRSWVEGYQNVIGPMHELSAKLHQRVAEYHARKGKDDNNDQGLHEDSRYQMALLYTMLLQCSCFRYWGQGQWTDYAKELYRRGSVVLEKPFG